MLLYTRNLREHRYGYADVVETGYDDIDRQIIETLIADGRATYAAIGEEVGLSVAATKRRVDRLRSTGAIRGFTALVDYGQLGWALEAVVSVYTNGVVAYDDMRRRLERIPEIIEAITVTGHGDTMIRLVAQDMAQVDDAIKRLRSLPQIERTDTVMVLSRLIDRPLAH